MYPHDLYLPLSRDNAAVVKQEQLEHYKKDVGQCFTKKANYDDNLMTELKNTNEVLKRNKSSVTANAGSFFGLPPEHILEFQKIAWEVSGMRLTYAEAWECGHTLTNFFDLLIRTDNEV
jgi:hypothetical protein